MNANNDDLYEIIQQMIEEETLYLRHFIGEVAVTNDSLKKGRVKVMIKELGFDTPDLGIWCYPRQSHSMSVPAVKSWVEVYFINGERERPVYLYPATEIIGNILKSYKGDPKEHILFESPENKNHNIKFDSKEKLLTFLNGSESFVLGDTFKTEMQKNIDALTQLQLDFASWAVTPLDGGAALKSTVTAGFLTKPLTSLANILSKMIKGK